MPRYRTKRLPIRLQDADGNQTKTVVPPETEFEQPETKWIEWALGVGVISRVEAAPSAQPVSFVSPPATAEDDEED